MFKKDEKIYKEFLYDFSKDGGAVGNITMKGVDPNGDSLDEGFIVQDLMVVNEEALTSTGTPTITFGPTVDSDGYMADCYAKVASLNAVCRAGEVDGDLVWDTTADAKKGCRIGSASNTQDLLMVVGTAPLTAGKLRVIVEGIKPGSSAHPA